MGKKIKHSYQVLGLMSGSSLDGLDIALCEFQLDDGIPSSWKILSADTFSYSQKWINRLANLPQQSALTFAKTHTYFGHYMAEFVLQFLENTSASPDFIASHGHTIFHHPSEMMTIQIGDGAALAAKTGLPVIADFRNHDVAMKGEGTPLAPTVDKYLFSEYDFLLNLGGIANLTYQTPTSRIAYDISPCNQILNALAEKIGKEYDENGKMAASGNNIPTLEEFIHQFPYFKQELPKSLDNQFIQKKFIPKILKYEASIADKMHTCCRVIGSQIAQNINKLVQKPSKLMISGGGAYHQFLIDCIRESLDKNVQLIIPDKMIIDYKEALLMALLGVLRIHNKTNCFAEITGAELDSIGGAIYQGTRKHI